MTVRNKFGNLQETSERDTPNNEYENFIAAHIEAEAECMPTKPIAKYRVPLESKAIREKQDSMIKVSLINKRNSKIPKCQKL